MPTPFLLFFCESVGLAHVGRSITLAKWAQSFGFRVAVACNHNYHPLIKEASLPHHELYSIKPSTFYGRLKKGFFFYRKSDLEKYFQEEVALMSKLKPDLVIGDFRLTLPLSSSNLQIPSLSLSNAHWSPNSDFNLKFMRQGISRLFPQFLWEFLEKKLRPFFFMMYAKNLNDFRRERHYPCYSDFRQHYTDSTYCAYCDSPLVEDLKGLIPKNHFYLGPVAWSPERVNHIPIPDHFIDKGFVYITLGSTGSLHDLETIIKALKNLPYCAFTSGVDEPWLKKLIHKNDFLKNRIVNLPIVNPENLLRKALITICHGGSGSVYQSLQAGVPVLCIPSNPDQQAVSKAVAEKNLGIWIKSRVIKPNDVVKAINELTQNSLYRKNSISILNSISPDSTRLNWFNFLHNALAITQTDLKRYSLRTRAENG